MEPALENLNLQDYITIFKEQGIDDDSFFLLDNELLKELIPLIGPRARILKLINEHNSSAGEKNATCQSEELVQTRTTEEPPNKLAKISIDPVEQMEPYLWSSLLGSSLIKAHRKRGMLLPPERTKLVTMIVEAGIEYHTTLNNSQIESMSSKIEEIFKGEDKYTYFIPPTPDKKMANGKLVDKYRNTRRICSMTEKNTQKPAEVTVTKDLESKLLFLENNTSPFPKVLQFWEETWLVRSNNSKNMKIEDIFQKYKALSSPQGFTLLESDFNQIYPEKGDLLLAAWPTLFPILLDACEKTRNCLKPEVFDSACQDLKDVMLLKMVMHILPPTTSSKVKGVKHKMSIAEAKDIFIVHEEDHNKVLSKLNEIQDKAKTLGQTVQPRLAVSGKEGNLEMAIYLNHVRFEVNTVIRGIDLLFKISNSLNLYYSPEAKNIMLFLQRHVFKIKTKFDKLTPSLVLFLKSVENSV